MSERASSLFEVATAAGLTATRLSFIERGLQQPTPEEITRLTEAIARVAQEQRP